MNRLLRRTVPAALLAGGAMLVATAGTVGAQVPVPGADGLPTGGVDSLSSAPSALCSGPLSALTGPSGVCEVAGEDSVQVGDAGQVLPQAGAQESTDQEYPVNVELKGDAEAEGDCGPDGDCDVPEGDCEGPGECPPPEEPCEECPTTTETTMPPHETTLPPSSETTVTTAPPTTQVAAVPPAEELPRTGSTVAPFVVAAGTLLAVGVALVASRRFVLGRRG